MMRKTMGMGPTELSDQVLWPSHLLSCDLVPLTIFLALKHAQLCPYLVYDVMQSLDLFLQNSQLPIICRVVT